MATPSMPQNQERVLCKIIAIMTDHTKAVEGKTGHATINRLKKHVWVCAGAPTGAYTTGMETNDLILDTTNDNVYIAAAEPATGVYRELTAITA